MKYLIPTINSHIDPILLEWVKTIPKNLCDKAGLVDCLLRIGHGIYEGGGITRDSNINPFYKMIEMLQKSKLEYWHLQKIKEYYHLDLINYLTKENRGEFYVGYPCNNPAQLRNALNLRNNITNENTLAYILANMV